MSALLTIATDLTAHSTAAISHGMVVASVSDTANTLIANWTGVIQGAAVLVAIVIVVVTAVKTRLAIASTTLSVVVAGILLWAVTADGLGWFSNSIDQEVTGSPAIVELLPIDQV